MVYRFSGDFEAQVRLSFNPTRCCQRAGLGIRSSQNPDNWIRIIRREAQALEIQASDNNFLDTVSYSDEMVYFKIERIRISRQCEV